MTKERLQLERHLQFANDSLQRNNGVDLNRFLALESTNVHLKQQLSSLEVLHQEYKVVEIQHRYVLDRVLTILVVVFCGASGHYASKIT